jgi:predicted metal-dependent peptidase
VAVDTSGSIVGRALDQFIAEEAKKQGNSNPVFVVMSTKDYEALSLNLAELKRYIDQQKQIIVYYEGATAPK